MNKNYKKNWNLKVKKLTCMLYRTDSIEPLLTATTNQVASQLEEQLFSSELFSYSDIIMDSKSIIIII